MKLAAFLLAGLAFVSVFILLCGGILILHAMFKNLD